MGGFMHESPGAAMAAQAGPTGEQLDAASVDRACVRAARRILPFLLLMYIVAFLDRTNIAFAKSALQTSAGIGPRAYALAAGLFFLSYAALEIPSNLILHRVGARIWMTRIMVSWGLISAGTAFVHSSHTLYALRLLLGAAEAGFFPGVILYLSNWFPARLHGRVLGAFYFGAPLAFIVGSPISGALLQMPPICTLKGWQWMFVIEGLLAVVVGLWAYWYLDNGPSSARWLPAGERRALESVLAREQRERSAHSPVEMLAMLRDRRMLHFALLYALIQASVYGVVFYLPSEVSSLLHTTTGLRAGLFSAIPWICALAATFLIPRMASAPRGCRAVAAVTLLVSGAAGFVLCSSTHWIAFVALSISAAGFIAVQPIFWTFPTGYLAGRAAAGIAFINAMGALGGFLAPNVKVWADTTFARPYAGTAALAALSVLGAVLMVALELSPRKAA